MAAMRPVAGENLMAGPISERAFEDAIECALLAGGPDACPGPPPAIHEKRAGFGVAPPGGYHRRTPDEYDRTLCLIPRDVIDFVVASQPKEWARLKEHHGEAVKEQFLQRLAREVEKRGVLDVLRHHRVAGPPALGVARLRRRAGVPLTRCTWTRSCRAWRPCRPSPG